MSFRDPPAGVIPNGLIASVAAQTFARFGYWPPDFLVMVKRFHRGAIPEHVKRLAAHLAERRPWDVCSHGVALYVDHPYCEKCMQ